MDTLADRIDDLLPQTQCRQCGFEGCRPYAESMAAGTSAINRCPPGGDAGIARLAELLQLPVLPLDESCGQHLPYRIAVIDEAACIGCAKCLPPCPTDAIVGANKQLHQVVPSLCTGCELCIAPCPVDCIRMEESPLYPDMMDKDRARERYRFHNFRRQRDMEERIAYLAAQEQNALKEVESRNER